MIENSKEPVVEQALDSIESNVSDKKMVTESPSTSKKSVSQEPNANQNNTDAIDYLSNSIFDDTKEVLIDDLLKDESESVEVIDDSRYISTFSEISEKKIILPAYGSFTGGIDSKSEIFKDVINDKYKTFILLNKNIVEVN